MGDETSDDPMRIWETDADGNRVLIGLTKDETDEYEAYLDKDMQSREDLTSSPWPSREEEDRETERYLELHAKHEKARHQVLDAERELLWRDPKIH